MASIIVEGLGEAICGPFFDANGMLHVLDSVSGSLILVNMLDNPPSKTEVINSEGAPAGAALDSKGVLQIADIGQAAVLSIENGEMRKVAFEYEQMPFKGPNSVAFDDIGNMFFTDSGPLGETSLETPTGSLYMITHPAKDQILKPISLGCLAHPCGIAVSKGDPDKACVYVCEMMMNRIIRYSQRPTGVFHASVFYQFSGSVGPSAIAVTANGVIYVAMYELDGLSGDGTVVALNTKGKVLNEISVPYSELTGLAVSPDGTGLYITEASRGAVIMVPIQA